MSRAFAPVTIGSWNLPQSFVMGPLTRNRAGAGNAPTQLNATYYAQRAGAGLIVTEGTAPSAVGQGYLNVPGLYTDEQVAGWRLVADAVHEQGGHIVAQLMHAGRIAHADNKDGAETISASAVRAPGEMVTANGPKPHDEPRALETEELAGVVEDYVTAARNAVAAGLDGVEIHAANGYLLHQFLDPTINLREDAHGGSPQNRARFVVEVVTAVAEAIGPEKVGLRISPGHQFNGVGEEAGEDMTATYAALVDAVSPLGLAYLSILASPLEPLKDLVADLRSASVARCCSTTASVTSPASRRSRSCSRRDSPTRSSSVARSWPTPTWTPAGSRAPSSTSPTPSTFYGGGAEGYTDYPTLEAS